MFSYQCLKAGTEILSLSCFFFKELITSLVAQTVKRLPTMQETRVGSLGQEDPLEKEMPLWYSCLENPVDGGA